VGVNIGLSVGKLGHGKYKYQIWKTLKSLTEGKENNARGACLSGWFRIQIYTTS
jgi:hypothetical protein